MAQLAPALACPVHRKGGSLLTGFNTLMQRRPQTRPIEQYPQKTLTMLLARFVDHVIGRVGLIGFSTSETVDSVISRRLVLWMM